MAININTLYILEELLKSKVVMTMRNIIEVLPQLKLTPRQFQNLMKEILENARAIPIGASVDTNYLAEPLQKIYKKYRFVFVYKDNELAGILVQRDSDYVFKYMSQYLVDRLQPIPTLELSLKPIVSDILFPVFEENLPEGVNKDILEISMRKTDDLDKLTSLTHNIGNLFFSYSDKEDKLIVKEKRKSFLSNEDEILGKNEFPNILKDFKIELSEEEIFPKESELTILKQKEMSGISGFQYKKLMELDYDKKSILEDETSRSFIFKPYSDIKVSPTTQHYLPHLAINEHLFMTFAKNELGFKVPASYLIQRKQDKEFHYLVKRFDRLGTQKYTKVTFATLLGLVSETKYKTSSEKMFERVKKELKSKSERMMLLKYYFYSMLITHEDMHTKNLSLIFDGDITLLAPLYDIATTSIYPFLKGYDSHLPINGQHSNITPKCFKYLTDIMEIKHSDFMKEASIIIKAYVEILPSYFEKIKDIDPKPIVFKVKRKILRGDDIKYYKDEQSDPIELGKLLKIKHKQRIEKLKELGWIKV